jgi:histidinol-phosphatase (PHP family)
MWANYHSHSNFCDGVGSLEEYVIKAESEGMRTIGFSSHAPVPFECSWCMKAEKLTEYVDTIDRLRVKYPNIELYKGMEIDFIPGLRTPSDFNDLLDYSVGSIHFIDNFKDGRPWEIDGNHAVFLQGLSEIFKDNIQAAIFRYFELTQEMVSLSRPTIVGHLDKIKIQNIGEKLYRETDDWYQEQIDLTLDVIEEAGVIVEVNTRGLYQKTSRTTYPSPWILEKIHKRDIPITLSSDAHSPKDLINQFTETASELLAIGFRKISILEDGSWRPVTLTPDGINY